jgi:hypothetical protein
VKKYTHIVWLVARGSCSLPIIANGLLNRSISTDWQKGSTARARPNIRAAYILFLRDNAKPVFSVLFLTQVAKNKTSTTSRIINED